MGLHRRNQFDLRMKLYRFCFNTTESRGSRSTFIEEENDRSVFNNVICFWNL